MGNTFWIDDYCGESLKEKIDSGIFAFLASHDLENIESIMVFLSECEKDLLVGDFPDKVTYNAERDSSWLECSDNNIAISYHGLSRLINNSAFIYSIKFKG